ncbi:hypothetical protein LAB1_46150 [Roseibium sp. LAB1]
MFGKALPVTAGSVFVCGARRMKFRINDQGRTRAFPESGKAPLLSGLEQTRLQEQEMRTLRHQLASQSSLSNWR